MRLVVLVASVVVVIVAAVAGVAMLRNDDGDGDVISSPPVASTAPTAVGPTSSFPEPTIPPSAPGAVDTAAPASTATTTTTAPTTTSATTTTTSMTTTTTSTTPPVPTTTTPVAPAVDLLACENEFYNYRLEYPASWYAELDDPYWECGLFDPLPFELVPDSELPSVAIALYVVPGSYDENRSIVAEPAGDTLIAMSQQRDLPGRRVLCGVIEATGDGYYDAGTLRLSCLVDWSLDTVLVEAAAWPWLDFQETWDATEAMVLTLEPLTPLSPVD